MIAITRRATEVEQAQAAHALLTAVIVLGIASTDDAHQRHEISSSVDQRVWGAITMRLIAEGIICRVLPDVHTTRREAHGRRIGRYYAPAPDRAKAYVARLSAVASRRPAGQMTLPGMVD